MNLRNKRLNCLHDMKDLNVKGLNVRKELRKEDREYDVKCLN